MSQLDSYVFFDGNCAEAMRFYEKTLGGTLEMMMTMGESPMADQVPAEYRDRIMHSSLELGGRRLMASDGMPGQPHPGIKGFSLALSYPTVDEGRRVFDALAQGGSVTMKLEKTFWVEAFGMCVDRFGVPWMVNAGRPLMG